jgi:phage-related baseplate assembly protein
MAGSFTVVDLSQLSAPEVVEQIAFDDIKALMIADLVERHPEFSALVESDPAYKIIEVCAYREVLVRQRTNEAALAVMLAYARGADLDQLGANYNVARLLIDAGDPDATPPVEPTYESDAEFRSRIPLSLEGYTTAGSEGSYVFHGLSADGDVKDIQAVSPTPGNVTVYVLSRTDDGEASPELIATVNAVLNGQDVRPMTDNVTIQSAAIVDYGVTAELVVYPGPDPDVVLAAAQAAIEAYATSVHRIGYDVTLSGIYAALHQPGVQRVNLTAPSANIVAAEGEAAFCSAFTITLADDPDV